MKGGRAVPCVGLFGERDDRIEHGFCLARGRRAEPPVVLRWSAACLSAGAACLSFGAPPTSVPSVARDQVRLKCRFCESKPVCEPVSWLRIDGYSHAVSFNMQCCLFLQALANTSQHGGGCRMRQRRSATRPPAIMQHTNHF